MSTEPEAPTTPPILSPLERRILGVLVEKQKTTPDAYPMSVNGLVTGSNQKSNRDPVMSLTDVDVEEGLLEAQKKGLAIRLTGGGRVEKWRHNLYEAWSVSKAEMAVLCELLLRGPQTEGELRSRVSRMEPMDDLDALRAVLRPLAERKLVVYLTPEGRRGTSLTHGFHSPQELQAARAAMPAEAAPVGGSVSEGRPPAGRPSAGEARPPVAQAPGGDAALAQLKSELAAARAETAALHVKLGEVQAEVAALKEQVREIRAGLGL
jgi:uncharacterized protein YceH (UPF0502 family)